MSDTKQLIESLDQKVDQLVAKLKRESELSSSKDGEITILKGKLSDQTTALDVLKTELESVKKASSESEKTNASAAKQRIDELVNEIDKCISLIKV